MKKQVVFFLMVFLSIDVNSQNIFPSIIIDGNISHLENILNANQIENYTLNDLRILRNTIFAKYGYKFNSNDLAEHFSQFAWYKNESDNVSEQLNIIDWKNIKLINELEYYYPLMIDYAFTIQHNGIYILDNEFILSPVYTTPVYTYTNWPDIHWWVSYFSYIQVDDFFLFISQGLELLYDYKTNRIIDDLGHIDNIISIEIKSDKTVIVNCIKEFHHPTIKKEGTIIPVTINYDNTRFENELIGTTIYNTNNEFRRKETKKNNGRSTRLDSMRDIMNTSNIFSMFNKNVLILLENNRYSNPPDSEHLSVTVIYNEIYNKYFLMVNNYGLMSR